MAIIMLDRMISVRMIMPVSTTIEDSLDTGHPDTGPSVDDILDGLTPMMAYQRRSMMRVWQDRSLSKLNLHVLMLLDHDEPGFWERNGYHDRGDPWLEQRYQGD